MMYLFNNFNIERKKQLYHLSCDILHQYDNENDELQSERRMVVTPDCWDRAIAEQLERKDLYTYHIFGVRYLSGFYNKLTDYRGATKLTNRICNAFEDSYVIPDGKVYCGISCTLGSCEFMSDLSPLIVLGPQLKESVVLSVLKMNNYDFCSAPSIELLHAISICCPNSLVLSYSSSSKSVLQMIDNINDIFLNSEVCSRWEQLKEKKAVFRRP